MNRSIAHVQRSHGKDLIVTQRNDVEFTEFRVLEFQIKRKCIDRK